MIMQLHAGWIAFIQTRVLNCLGCLWFNRNEVGLLARREASRYACTLPRPPLSGQSLPTSNSDCHCCIYAGRGGSGPPCCELLIRRPLHGFCAAARGLWHEVQSSEIEGLSYG